MAEHSNSKYYITPKEAISRQKKLRQRINIRPFDGELRTVAGADISFNRGSNELHAGFVVLELPDLNVVSCSLATKTVDFPYIPGLLSFREIPALLKAWKQLVVKPDVLVMDGHGLAHPRRMGIATQFGITVDTPTMGCAKNILTGEYKPLAGNKGDFQYITDGNEKIGIVYRSRKNVKPIFISPGNKVSFDDTRSIIAQCLTRYKLPETTRQVHQSVNRLRKGEWKAGYYKGLPEW